MSCEHLRVSTLTFIVQICLLLTPSFLYSENNEEILPMKPLWYENIFFSVSGQYYIIPDITTFIPAETARQYGIEKGIIAYPGFRAGIGYEWNFLRFEAETGYTNLIGDNPLVKEITFVPLLFKAGYIFIPIPNYTLLNITPSLGIGMIMATVQHYESVINILTENISTSQGNGFLLQAGIRVGWTPFSEIGNMVEVFAGFSLDSIIEKDGTIPLPQFELGFIVRPFTTIKKVPDVIQQSQVIEDSIIEESEIEEIEEIIIVNPEPEIFTHSFRVLFRANTTNLAAGNREILDEAIDTARNYDNHKITLRGYTAPFGTSNAQQNLSRQRVLYCINYLSEKFGSSGILINVEWYGADRIPDNTEESEHTLRRSVEIIIEGWNNP